MDGRGQTPADWFSTGSPAPFPGGGDVRLDMAGPSHQFPASDGPPGSQDRGGAPGGFFDGIKSQMTATAMNYVAEEALTATKSRATGLSRYLSIQWLVDRAVPYFQVDGKIVLQRLLGGVTPRCQQFSIHSPDLYGPLVVVLTLATLLIMSIKFNRVQLSVDGTAIGTSLALCFGYWWGSSAVYLVLSYLTESNIGFPNILCATGYSMASYLITFTAAYISRSSAVFYLLYFTVGLIAGVSLGLTFKETTADRQKGLIVLGASAGVHLLFLMYLRMAYLTLP